MSLTEHFPILLRIEGGCAVAWASTCLVEPYFSGSATPTGISSSAAIVAGIAWFAAGTGVYAAALRAESPGRIERRFWWCFAALAWFLYVPTWVSAWGGDAGIVVDAAVTSVVTALSLAFLIYASRRVQNRGLVTLGWCVVAAQWSVYAIA